MGKGKGQISSEMLAVAVVMMLLFLIVIAVIVQKNFFTTLMSNVNEDVEQCNRVASLIETFQSSPGYSETEITLESSTHIEKKSIKVGDHWCRYPPNVKMATGSEDYTLDTTGFDLSPRKGYKIKKTSEGVIFCDASQDWC